jgi:hypothetical protein
MTVHGLGAAIDRRAHRAAPGLHRLATRYLGADGGARDDLKRAVAHDVFGGKTTGGHGFRAAEKNRVARGRTARLDDLPALGGTLVMSA